MPLSDTNIQPWRTVLFDGYAPGFAAAARTLFRVVIEPACRALAAELQASSRGVMNPEIDRWEALRTAQIELHQSFALALGALWERNFREHLKHSAAIIVDRPSKRLMKRIEGPNWNDLLKAFLTVRGFELSLFPMWPELELLHHVSSAVRHGDGDAAKKLHSKRPDLFLSEDVRSGWFAYYTLGGDPPHAVKRLDLSVERLAGFSEALAGYWETVAELSRSGAQ